MRGTTKKTSFGRSLFGIILQDSEACSVLQQIMSLFNFGFQSLKFFNNNIYVFYKREYYPLHLSAFVQSLFLEIKHFHCVFSCSLVMFVADMCLIYKQHNIFAQFNINT